MSDQEKIQEYREAIRHVIMIANMTLSMHDIPKLLADIERADAVGWIYDPTLYRDKLQAMNEDREVLNAALPLWKLAKEIQKRKEATKL